MRLPSIGWSIALSAGVRRAKGAGAAMMVVKCHGAPVAVVVPAAFSATTLQ